MGRLIQARRDRVKALYRDTEGCTGLTLTLWRLRHGLKHTDAALLLGVSRDRIRRMEEGGKLPRYISLACSAISNSIPPIS